MQAVPEFSTTLREELRNVDTGRRGGVSKKLANNGMIQPSTLWAYPKTL